MSNVLKKKLFSGSLQFAIFTAAIVALLLFALILYLTTFKTFQQNSQINIQNIKTSNSAFNAVLNNDDVITDSIILNDFEDKFQTSKTISSYWGIFQKATATTTNRTKKFTKTALIGSRIESQKRVALYLKNNFKPLVVVGNTIIKGNVRIPDQGVRPGNIAGNSYYGTQLIYGNITNSAVLLPKLNKTFVENVNYLLDKAKPINEDNFFALIQINTNSFNQPTQWIYSKNVIDIQDEFVGNFIIKSDTLVRISRTSKLKDIVIIAPTIIIEDGVKGNFQAIASKNITIGRNVVLNYPSALILKPEENTIQINQKKELILIDENSIIKGVVCYLSKKEDDNFTTHLICSKDSKIIGEVYCQGNFELIGSVFGTVYTNQFVSNTAGTIFVNHLYNATITSENFPDFYSGLLFEKENKSILKWLY